MSQSDYVREKDVGTEKDVPHAWTIVVESMTVAKAREVGRVLAKHGLHGHFLDGDLANCMREYAKWRHEQRGGEADGN